MDASYRWQSGHLRGVALERLQKLTITTTNRLKLTVKYDLHEWQPGAYQAILSRHKPPTEEELQVLGQRHALRMLQAREFILGYIAEFLLQDCTTQECCATRMARSRQVLFTGWSATEFNFIDRASGPPTRGERWCRGCSTSREDWNELWTSKARQLAIEIFHPHTFGPPVPDQPDDMIA